AGTPVFTFFFVADWSASAAFPTNSIIVPEATSNAPDFPAFKNLGAACVSGAAQPNWATAQTLGATIGDGTCTWTNVGQPAGSLVRAESGAIAYRSTCLNKLVPCVNPISDASQAANAGTSSISTGTMNTGGVPAGGETVAFFHSSLPANTPNVQAPLGSE